MMTFCQNCVKIIILSSIWFWSMIGGCPKMRRLPCELPFNLTTSLFVIIRLENPGRWLFLKHCWCGGEKLRNYLTYVSFPWMLGDCHHLFRFLINIIFFQIVFISGLPGAGKSSTARTLAAQKLLDLIWDLFWLILDETGFLWNCSSD